MLEEILAGSVPEVETAALLAVLATRGEQAPELAGFVDVMRRHSVPLPFTDAEREQLVDCVGTGGGGPQTFNISCGAALVAAAAGANVAKHGNRAVTSRCGAADVFEALGVPIDLSPEQAVECLRETGFVFLFAPLYHPAMKALGPLRRALGFRTIFNLVGPLTNPAHARTQVIGVLAPSRVLLVGRALAALGARRAFVVHGTDGIDELTTTGESVVARIEEIGSGQAGAQGGARHAGDGRVAARRRSNSSLAATWPRTKRCSTMCSRAFPARGAILCFSTQRLRWWPPDLAERSEARRTDGRGSHRLWPSRGNPRKAAAVRREAHGEAVGKAGTDRGRMDSKRGNGFKSYKA